MLADACMEACDAVPRFGGRHCAVLKKLRGRSPSEEDHCFSRMSTATSTPQPTPFVSPALRPAFEPPATPMEEVEYYNLSVAELREHLGVTDTPLVLGWEKEELAALLVELDRVCLGSGQVPDMEL